MFNLRVVRLSQPLTLRAQLFQASENWWHLIINQWQATQLFVVASFESNYKSIITKIILNIVIVIANHFRVLTSCHSEHFLDVPDKQQTWRNNKTPRQRSGMSCYLMLDGLTISAEIVKLMPSLGQVAQFSRLFTIHWNGWADSTSSLERWVINVCQVATLKMRVTRH